MMEQTRIIFGSIPTYLYPHLITAILVGVAIGLILGLTFVYSILFTPMQRRLKREVVNIQMDNEKLKKDFSHYKRRARRKLKYYRDLDLRSIRPDAYDDVEELVSDTDAEFDEVDAALERSTKAVESLSPEKKTKSTRYARAARGETVDDSAVDSSSSDELKSESVHEVDVDENGEHESIRDSKQQNSQAEAVVPPVAILDDITELAMQFDKDKKTRSSRKSKTKASFIDSIRSKQESLAKQFSETDEFDESGMTQTIETPLQKDDIDNWQDFENEFGKELSNTSNALDIHHDADSDESGLASLRIEDTDLVEKNLRRGSAKNESRKKESRKEKLKAKKLSRSKSKKTETVIVDETVEIDQDIAENSVPKPRITGKSRKPGRRKSAESDSGGKRTKTKDSPVEGFMSALRRRRTEMDEDVDEHYEDDERQAG